MKKKIKKSIVLLFHIHKLPKLSQILGLEMASMEFSGKKRIIEIESTDKAVLTVFPVCWNPPETCE